MRKLTSIVCCVVIIFGVCGHLAANAENITDLLGGYGGFEQGLYGWNDAGSQGSSFAETGTVRTGSGSLKIVNNVNGAAPWVMIIYSGLIPGATYVVEGYINGYFTGSNGAGFKTEVYDGASEGKETKIYDSTNDLWVKITHRFVAPPGGKKVKVYCRIYTTGTVYFDDVVMYMAEPPAPFMFTTKDIFHYSDDTVGTATVSLNDYYQLANYSNKAAKFSIVNDSSGQEVHAQVLDFTQRTLTYNYSPKLLEEKTKYTLKIRVYDKTTNVEETSYTQSLYRYKRPTMLGSDGFVRFPKNALYPEDDGRPFNPVIAYHVTNTADYAYMKSIGVNVVQVPYWYTSRGEAQSRENLLNELASHGLKALFCLYRNMKMPNDPANYNNTNYVVDLHKDDPRIFAWALMDEPLGAGVTDQKLSDLETSFKMIRDIDTMHPIYIVDFTPTYFLEDLKFCDIFAVDPYNYSLTGVTGMTSKAVELAESRKPVYTIVGTFKTGNGSFPGPGMVRHMTYQALVYGAKGFGYYSFEDSITASLSPTGVQIPLYNTEIWDDMCEYAETDMALAFENIVHNPAPITIKGNIAEKTWSKGNEEYFFIMSMSDQAATKTYSTYGNEVEVVYGTEPSNVAISAVAGTTYKQITVNVPSGEIMLLKVKNVNKPDNLITNGDFEGVNGSLYDEADNTKIAYWKNAANCLIQEPNGNHYFMNNTGSGTYLSFMKQAEPKVSEVYELSFRYKHPSGTVPQIRFNAGTTTYDYSVNDFVNPGVNEWRTHVMYIKMPVWGNNNHTQFGRYTGSALSGAWCVDNLTLLPVTDRFVFSRIPSGLETTWSSSENRGSAGKTSNNTLKYKTAVYDEISSLSMADTDNEGNRLVYGVFNKTTIPGEKQTAVMAVYKVKNGIKMLYDINIINVTAEESFTTVAFPVCKIPPRDENTEYEVSFMNWDSVVRMKANREKITILD